MPLKVGGHALWTPHSWVREGEAPRVLVLVLDSRKAFGRTDYLVRPIRGEGETWAQESVLIPADADDANGRLTDAAS